MTATQGQAIPMPARMIFFLTLPCQAPGSLSPTYQLLDDLCCLDYPVLVFSESFLQQFSERASFDQEIPGPDLDLVG
jgi:hypothetical protein